MAKCHENRKARRKRDRKQLLRLTHKQYDELVLASGGGRNPKYYDVRYGSVPTRVVGGRRVIDVRKLKARVVPNAKYHETVAFLTGLCGGLTVRVKAFDGHE